MTVRSLHVWGSLTTQTDKHPKSGLSHPWVEARVTKKGTNPFTPQTPSPSGLTLKPLSTFVLGSSSLSVSNFPRTDGNQDVRVKYLSL